MPILPADHNPRGARSNIFYSPKLLFADGTGFGVVDDGLDFEIHDMIPIDSPTRKGLRIVCFHNGDACSATKIMPSPYEADIFAKVGLVIGLSHLRKGLEGLVSFVRMNRVGHHKFHDVAP